MTVWEGFESAATRFADRPAVQLQRAEAIDSWTYRQLHEAALARARWLAGVGIKPGDRCAIYADNDAAWCGTYLGVLRVGAVAVPLDTNYSPKQVGTIVRDSIVPYATDSNGFRPLGVKSYGFTPAILPADVVASMHGDAEYVPTDAIGPAIRIIYDALVETARKR